MAVVKFFQTLVEIVIRPKIDPVKMSDLEWTLLRCNIPQDEGDQPFAIFYGMFNFLFAYLGKDGIRTSIEDEDIRFFNPLFNLLPPIDSWRNVLPVNPAFHALIAQGLCQSVDCIDIFT